MSEVQQADNPQGSAYTVDSAADALGALLGNDNNEPVEAAPDASEEEESQPDELELPDEEDEETATEEPEEPEEEPLFTVKIDGEEKQVTQAELIAGYQKDADYRRKTAAIAEERRTLAEESNAVRAERERYAKVLDGLEAQLKTQSVEEPDFENLEDPKELAKYAKWQRHQLQLQQVEGEKQRLDAQRQQQWAEQQRKAAEEGLEKLKQEIPSWAKEETMQADLKALVSYGKTLGYTDEQLAGVVDPRFVKLLYDSHRLNKLKASKLAKPKPKTIQPGSKAQPRRTEDIQKARQRLAQSGRPEDAAALIGLL